jgi:hypothetical protein
MELNDPTAAETARREEEAFVKHLERAGELTRDWPEWKRNVLRSWPNSAAAAAAEARESEREDASNGTTTTEPGE